MFYSASRSLLLILLYTSLVIAYNDPPPTSQAIQGWFALGDSFASGPGAGPTYKGARTGCVQRAKAYPAQLEATQLFHKTGSKGFDDPTLNFLACSGADSSTVQSSQTQGLLNTSIITLSAGSNDVGLSNVIRQCIYNSNGNCSQSIATATDLIYGNDFYLSQFALHYSLFAITKWSLRTNNSNPSIHTTIYQTSYPQFFDDYTTGCDSRTFMPSGIKAPTLSQSVRDSINFFSQQLNYILNYWIDNFNTRAVENIDFIRFADQDERYTGHRFCRAGVQEPATNNANNYFFHLFDHADKLVKPSAYSSIKSSSCSTSAGPEIAPGLECIISQDIASGQRPGKKNQWPDPTTDALKKVFHPAVAGHSATTAELTQRLSYKLDNNGGLPMNKNLRILSIGDSITWGYQSTEGSGYRKPLYEILSSNNVTFLGTQTSGQSGSAWEHSEGYPGYKVADIVSNVTASGSLNESPDIVLFMIGTNDVNSNSVTSFSDLSPALTELESFIDTIFTSVGLSTTLILAHIPPIGYEDFGWPMSTKQMLVSQWNAKISQMVNRKKAQHPKYKLLKVHTTVTVNDHHTDDTLHPSDDGYQKLACDFAERISDAADFGWIE